MLKFIFGVGIVAFTSFCGHLLAKKYRQRKLFFTQLKEFNERFLSEISYYRRPIREFVAAYAYRGEFEAFLHVFYETMGERSNQDRAFVDGHEYAFLTQEDKRVVEDYFLMLGRGDSASQKAYFTSVKSGIEKLQIEADTQCKRYGDLYIKLGFLCGLLILLLMI